ncbi:MAG TPA: hypothetical protein VKJ01_24395 [Candidatus Solibacter sp.]|nr:hypothetical protein [Candidatus Solibacter sp.]
MRLVPWALVFLGAAGCVRAQNAPAPASCTAAVPVAAPAAVRELRHRLGLVATRAIAYFRSADSIAENLKEQGAALHPETVSLRLRLEAALDETDKAIDQCHPEVAGKALERAQALLGRFAAKLGG